MQTVGVIGYGFVGQAVCEGMNHAFDVTWYDKYRQVYDGDFRGWRNVASGKVKTRVKEIADLAYSVDGPIFVCVPTPMKKDGSCDISIVESVVREINDCCEDKIVVIKSTVVPTTTEKLNDKYKNISCVFNPEFLRESSFLEDFKKQDRIIIGGPHEATAIVKQMYQIAYPEVPTTKTSSTIAEMVKYVTNCFLACKVSFANEIWQICQALDVDFDKIIEYATKDTRLGMSHWAVPGPDGLPAWGGKCFAKDLNALIYKAKDVGIDPMIMVAAWEKNLLLRPEKDWEKIPGVISGKQKETTNDK